MTHTFDSSDAMSVRNTINDIIHDIHRDCPTDKNTPFPDYIKELLSHLRAARDVLVERFGIEK